MKIVNMTILALAAFILGAQMSSCSIPGTEGHGRYKTELLSTLASIDNDINQKGAIQEKNVTKLEKVLEKWIEFEKKGSYIRGKEVLKLCKDSLADEGKRFMINQNIKLTNDAVRSYMQTEGGE